MDLASIKKFFASLTLQKLVPVQFADHAAGIVVIGDIGRVLCQQVTDDLVDRVVTFFVQGVGHTPEDTVHILFVITGNRELDGVFRHGIDLLYLINVIIA